MRLGFVFSTFKCIYKKLKKGSFMDLFDESREDDTEDVLPTEIWNLQNEINLFNIDRKDFNDDNNNHEIMSTFDDRIVDFQQ